MRTRIRTAVRARPSAHARPCAPQAALPREPRASMHAPKPPTSAHARPRTLVVPSAKTRLNPTSQDRGAKGCSQQMAQTDSPINRSSNAHSNTTGVLGNAPAPGNTAAPDNAPMPDDPAAAIDRERARAAFLAYVAPYDPANPRIALKVTHTLHVADLCDRIAREQGWPAADVDLAWLCGLLHDMGRFEQVRRWNTFRDAVSCSHAKLGASVLFGERERLGEPVPAATPDFNTPRIRDFIDSSAKDAATRAFDARRCMLRDDRSQPADFLVSFACFAFELAYPQSRGIMRKQGYATALLTKPFGIEAPFRNSHTRSELQRMAHELGLYLEGVHE